MFTPDSDITYLPHHFIYDSTIRAFLQEKDSLLEKGVDWKHVIHTCAMLEIDVRFILARIILESAWGRSRIALEKQNILGWNAKDKKPFKNAMTFACWTDCTIYVLHQLHRFYIHRKVIRRPAKNYRTIKQIMGRYSSANDAKSTVDLMNQIEQFRIEKEDNI